MDPLAEAGLANGASAAFLQSQWMLISYMAHMRSHSRLKIIMPDESVAPVIGKPKQASPHEIRPMAQVRRIALIEREIRETLSQAALDAVFAHAEVISEGEARPETGKTVFLGSTMLTCDLAATSEILREPADDGTARRLGALLAKDKSFDRRIESIVRREVERITGAQPKKVRGETRIRIQGALLFLDVDVEAIW
jgi:hypothetical protein